MTLRSRDMTALKIAPPPSEGIYLGQYEWVAGDISSMQGAAKRFTSFYSPDRGHWAYGYSSGHPSLDVGVATTAWEQGRIIVVQSYNLYAGTDDEHPAGFTVDQLLAGTYDSNLETYAAQLREFGKPCFMQCGREPNGVGQDYMGGYGADGTQSLSWAITNESAYGLFVPPAVPSGAPSDLYDGCSGATMPDGIGRLKAGQRYLHDFFVRREGLDFLTWDTQGFAARYYVDGSNNQDVSDSNDYPGHEAYALTLLERCSDPANWYPGDDYADWVSLTWYTLDYYDSGWTWLSGSDILISTSDWLTSLNHMYTAVQGVTSKPIILVECGFPDGMDSDTSYGASKVTDGMAAILDTYTQIRAVALWSNHPSWFMVDVFPYDCLFRPGTLNGAALQDVLAQRHAKIHTHITLSDGGPHPYRVL